MHIAMCALAIYIAWWKKPLDVEEPAQLRLVHDSQFQVIAGMCCHEDLDCKKFKPKWMKPVGGLLVTFLKTICLMVNGEFHSHH